jgi:hypothetical protein
VKPLSIEELRVVEQEAKQALELAVQAVKKANDAVTVAHKAWMRANNTLTEALIRAEAGEKPGK